MNITKWLSENTTSLAGKTVAITGSTGGLGGPLCDYLCGLGASLVLLDRNRKRSEEHKARLLDAYPGCNITCMHVDLADVSSVASATEALLACPPDVLLCNAGAYKIPRCKCATGLDNIFQINFASPYYMIRRLLPTLREKGGRVVVVGSIAHNYSKADPHDVDFSTRRAESKVYGNAKRYLMYALYTLFKEEKEVSLAVTHPGISFTNITAHYPKVIFALIKHPMKVIFMRPKVACLSLLRGLFEDCGYREWIGPRFFDVWGKPRKRVLRTADEEEVARIAVAAETVYRDMDAYAAAEAKKTGRTEKNEKSAENLA